MNLPYLTAELPGIGGELKVTPEDFFVEEIPLYLPSGTGQHIYAEIEKRGQSTYAAVRNIAQALGISPRAIGHAGLKDAQAITRQTISIDRVTPEAVQALDLSNIKVLKVNRHRNKLRTGHLAGNRFAIRVRNVSEDGIATAKAVLDVLGKKGVPNFFGRQRFGNRANTDKLGKLLISDDAPEFVAEYLGRPQPHEAPPVQAARRLIDEGNWAEALASWPRMLSDERRALAAINNANGQLDVIFETLNPKIKGFFVSAFQSRLFNQLLSDRLDQIGQLEDGDVAYIHGKGAVFVVKNARIEQPRADRFEISPSGPLFGPKTVMAEGIPGQKEEAVLAKYQLTPGDFNISGLKIRGTRRPYRFKLEDIKIWWDEGLMVSFVLPPGAYATRVMAEIMKQ